MRLRTFDKLFAAKIILSVLFSIIAAVTLWDWFPSPGEWGDIAHRPNNILNDAGNRVRNWWDKLKNKYKNIELHRYIVMPDHFHGCRGGPVCLP